MTSTISTNVSCLQLYASCHVKLGRPDIFGFRCWSFIMQCWHCYILISTDCYDWMIGWILHLHALTMIILTWSTILLGSGGKISSPFMHHGLAAPVKCRFLSTILILFQSASSITFVVLVGSYNVSMVVHIWVSIKVWICVCRYLQHILKYMI
jgi:hypothetical protein